MLHIRPATPSDVAIILRFIRELADYERALDQVIATEADLLRDGFALAPDAQTPLASRTHFRCLIAEWTEPSEAGKQPEPAGFALFFESYSTWVGHHGIRLEDVYVTPARRGHGIGKALLAALARIAVDEGCSRLEWDVLTWNEPALAFYARIGASVQDEWRIMRLGGEPLQALANTSGSPAEPDLTR